MVRKLANPDVHIRPQQHADNPAGSPIPTRTELPSVSKSTFLPSHEPFPLQTAVEPSVETAHNVGGPGSTSDSDAIDTGSDWDQSDEEEGTKPGANDIPAALKVGASQRSLAQAHEKDALPATLRIDLPDAFTRRSQENQRSEDPQAATSEAARDSTAQRFCRSSGSQNPYLRLQKIAQDSYGGENSVSRWDEPAPLQAQAAAPPPPPFELPCETTPVDEMSRVLLDDWATGHGKALGGTGNGASNELDPPRLVATETNKLKHFHLMNGAQASSTRDPSMTTSSREGSAPYESALTHPGQAEESSGVPRTDEEQEAWEQNQRNRGDIEATPAEEAASFKEQQRDATVEWYGPEASLQKDEGRPALAAQHEQAPSLPPRRSLEVQEQAPPKPPRPQADGAQNLLESRSQVVNPQAAGNRQRIETYQIKSVNWYDYSSKTNPRRSPILIQNANGPCPLLALVNALVLTTPSGIDTALVGTLRTREQISLGLLLDAVFDELTSGRRGGSSPDLPDVSELYAFLLALHTGMNVNPLFVPSAASLNRIDADNRPVPSDHPAHRSRPTPGEFELTREMRLYSTFNVPLIHGWLPPSDSPTYLALQRSAPTFEDAQNVQLREEELEGILRTQGLSPSEQQLYEDIVLIKQFLSVWPTQLTHYGLQVLRESLEPGKVAILFRNDHFSTLYKHPDSHLLMSLVTDAGYSTHDEIVWESLIDVSGQGSELFSGDFRSVGGQPAPELPPSETSSSQQPVRHSLTADGTSQWATVGSRKRNRSWKSGPAQPLVSTGVQETGVTSGSFSIQSIVSQPQPAPVSIASSTISPSQQEDHDLALALQLQEEEEDRHRRETEARRRENDLSMRFLSQDRQSQGGRPSGIPREIRDRQARPIVPPRRSNINQNFVGTEEPAPPPTYEQAASGPQFHPPRGHPASPHAPLQNASSSSLPMNRQQSGYHQQSAYHATAPAAPSRWMVQSSQNRRASGRGSSLNLTQGQGARRAQDSGIVAGSANIGPGGMVVTHDRDERCVMM